MNGHMVHLLASPFLGGPERQVLGLAQALAPTVRTSFISFAERGLARPFLDQARHDGFDAHELRQNFPRIDLAITEVASLLRKVSASVLCCSGYKPDLIGWRAARVAGIPVLAIAHGWTGATWKVRINEWLDARVMNWVDTVVCVSDAMAERVKRAGVTPAKVITIRNALDATPYDTPEPGCRQRVQGFFSDPPSLLVGAVGRLSPEKGFDVLLQAANRIVQHRHDVGFLVFGEGPARPALEEGIRRRGLERTFVLGGFHNDLHRYLPGLDLAVSSSHTEGLPVALLEAQAAGLPVVATAVGGTPEVVLDGKTGLLVPPADPIGLASAIEDLLANPRRCRDMGQRGFQRVRAEFTFTAQALRYQELLARLPRPGRGDDST